MEGRYLEVLAQSVIFQGFDEEGVRKEIEGMHYQLSSYKKGDLVAQAGSPCDFARIILEGSVAGEMMDLSGKVLKIEDMHPSKMIAPAFLYGKRRQYPVNVVSVAKTVIFQIHRDEFSKLLQQSLHLLDNYLNAISNRAQFLSEKIRFLSFPTLRSKLAFLFIQHGADGKEFQLPMTHQQIAELFGVARPSISREISNMNAEGIIESARDRVRILNLNELRNLLNRN